eukprot:Gb_04680 [translate_table: standard]
MPSSLHLHVDATPIRPFTQQTHQHNSLVAMYGKCGSREVARQLFDKMSKRNVVSWSAMIAGYAQSGHATEALILFNQMQLTDIKPETVTMVSVLQACAHLRALQLGKSIHDYITRSRFEIDAFLGTALVDMYSKCGSIEIARQVFDKMAKRNVVSWSAMIVGYAQNGHSIEALTLCHQMQLAGTKPCLVTMRCGLMECNDCWVWNNGHGEDALALFLQMQQSGMKPDHITFISVLTACSHAGLVDEGWKYFDCIGREYCIKPIAEYYACMVDLLGCAAHLDEEQDFIKKMPLESCARVLEFCLVPAEFTQVGGMTAQRLHPQSEKNYATLDTLAEQMMEAGLVPNMNFVLHNVEEELNEHILYIHSEKLAIAFGLINTAHGTPIRVMKNFRVCGDCHSATKFISKIVKREIVVRDTKRFHHF